MGRVISEKKDSLFKRMMSNKESYILMLPYMILFFIFTLLPVGVSFVLSFSDYNMLQMPSFVGWDNYTRMFLKDEVFLTAIRNTLMFALVTGPLGYVLSFVLAWFINDLSKFGRSIATTLFYAPALSGQIFTVWLFIFSPDAFGIMNGWLMKLGAINEPIGWLVDTKYNMNILIIVQLWLSVGTGFLAFIAGLQSVDKSLYEAGVIDGIRSRFQELWNITLPSMLPQLIFGAVMQLITSFAVADISIRLCGFPSTEYSAETIVTHIMDFGSIRYEMGYACAIATILFIIMIVTNKFITGLLRKIGS